MLYLLISGLHGDSKPLYGVAEHVCALRRHANITVKRRPETPRFQTKVAEMTRKDRNNGFRAQNVQNLVFRKRHLF